MEWVHVFVVIQIMLGMIHIQYVMLIVLLVVEKDIGVVQIHGIDYKFII